MKVREYIVSKMNLHVQNSTNSHNNATTTFQQSKDYTELSFNSNLSKNVNKANNEKKSNLIKSNNQREAYNQFSPYSQENSRYNSILFSKQKNTPSPESQFRKSTPSFISNNLNKNQSPNKLIIETQRSSIYETKGVQLEDVADEMIDDNDQREQVTKLRFAIKTISHKEQQDSNKKFRYFESANVSPQRERDVFQSVKTFIHESESASSKLVEAKQKVLKKYSAKQNEFQQLQKGNNQVSQHNQELEKTIELLLQKQNVLQTQVSQLTEQLDDMYQNYNEKINYYKIEFVEMSARREAQRSEMDGNIYQKQIVNEQKAENNKKLKTQIELLEQESNKRDLMLIELKNMIRKAADREEGTLKTLNQSGKDKLGKILELKSGNQYQKSKSPPNYLFVQRQKN